MSRQDTKVTVLAFLQAWETGVVATFDKWIHPDCLRQNTGLNAQKGKPAVMAFITQYNEIMQVPYGGAEIPNIACTDSG
jgi:limonene-1,2-epoxide hydrolase